MTLFRDALEEASYRVGPEFGITSPKSGARLEYQSQADDEVGPTTKEEVHG